jgi:S1-C subfamily serine protease
MRSPRHLWSGDWRSDSDRSREAAEEGAARHRAAVRAAQEAAAARAAAAGSSRGVDRLARRLAAVALVVAALAGGAFAVDQVLGGGSDGPAPLPAVSTQAIKPRQGQTRAGAIYAQASPAVVSVRTNEGSGTGFLIDRDGTLVTNAHVVGSESRVIVRFGPDGDSLDADVLGVDASSDLAVLSIAREAIPKGAKPLGFADSRTVRVGDTAIAIGNPFGLDRTATEGIVSGLGREIQAPNGFSIDQVIQTDAPINPGNSGGPLLDDAGRVIGVNSQIATSGGSQGNVGIGFAVPSNTVREVVPKLKRGQTIERPYLGVQTGPPSLNAAAGAEVKSVNRGGPADRAGLKVGDVITKVGGRQIGDPSDVSKAIEGRRVGDTVAIEVDRDGRTKRVKLKLGNRPQRTP